MIPYLYLIGSVFFVSSMSICSSCYSRKNAERNDPMPLYMLVMSGCVLLGWLTLWLLDFSFDRAVLPYSLLFAVSYAAGTFGIANAIKCGPVALSALISQLSMIGTTVWGFFFWNDSVTLTVVTGLICVVVSLFLCLYVKGDGKERPCPCAGLFILPLPLWGTRCVLSCNARNRWPLTERTARC